MMFMTYYKDGDIVVAEVVPHNSSDHVIANVVSVAS
jgi:hypothetical protein